LAAEAEKERERKKREKQKADAIAAEKLKEELSSEPLTEEEIEEKIRLAQVSALMNDPPEVEAAKKRRETELHEARLYYGKINSERNEIINKENEEKAILEKKEMRKINLKVQKYQTTLLNGKRNN